MHQIRYRTKRSLEREEYDPLDPAKQHEPVGAGALVSAFVDERVLKGASDASRALVTWRRVAGLRASRHTVAVWLNRPKSGRGLPELVVYLDGNALMADLTTNAELYVERLAYAGLQVARVRFRLSRRAGQPGAVPTAAPMPATSATPSGTPAASVSAAPVGPGGRAAATSPSSLAAPMPAAPGPIPALSAPVDPATLPPLSPVERMRVCEACAALPDDVRASASKAMELSLRRQKLQTTQNVSTPPETRRWDV